MLKNPPAIEQEIDFRIQLLETKLFNLSPIIILDSIEIGRYVIYVLSKIYHDIRENLVLMR